MLNDKSHLSHYLESFRFAFSNDKISGHKFSIGYFWDWVNQAVLLLTTVIDSCSDLKKRNMKKMFKNLMFNFQTMKLVNFSRFFHLTFKLKFEDENWNWIQNFILYEINNNNTYLEQCSAIFMINVWFSHSNLSSMTRD